MAAPLPLPLVSTSIAIRSFFFHGATNYHCKRPVPVKVPKRMGFRYDFQNKKNILSRWDTEREKERGQSNRTLLYS